MVAGFRGEFERYAGGLMDLDSASFPCREGKMDLSRIATGCAAAHEFHGWGGFTWIKIHSSDLQFATPKPGTCPTIMGSTCGVT